MTAAPPAVRLDGVSRVFGEGSTAVHALREVCLEVGDGEYVSVVGQSGSGKSTLLNILALLDRPDSGSYLLDGVDVSGLGDSELAALRGRRVGLVFQAFHLMRHRTAIENVMVALLYGGVPRGLRRSLAEEALERVGLAHRLDHTPTTLSGGEAQRVAIARAIVARPSLLLCDEPTGNLDSVTSESVLAIFDDLRRDGLTMVLVTHDDEVSRRADRVERIVDGGAHAVAAA